MNQCRITNAVEIPKKLVLITPALKPAFNIPKIYVKNEKNLDTHLTVV